MPLFGARHGAARPGAGILSCDPTKRWIRTRVLSAVCLCRLLPRRQEGLQDAVKAGSSQTYPEPVSHCDICRWWKECESQWRRDDHLSFVAGASRLQRKELTLQGVPSLESLARLPLP